VKHLESQISEQLAKLDQSQREIQELHSAKSRAQAETADLTQKLEEAESQLNQLNKAKQVLARSLEEVKSSLEDESRIRTKLQGEHRNMQSELEQLREQVRPPCIRGLQKPTGVAWPLLVKLWKIFHEVVWRRV